MKSWMWVLFIVLGVTAGCTYSAVQRPSESTEQRSDESASNADFEALVFRVELFRDREFQRAPQFVAIDSTLDCSPKNALNTDIRRDVHAVATGLGISERPQLEELVRACRLRRLARYDAEQHRIEYFQGHANERELTIAMVLAVVDALNSEHFEPLPVAMSWDEALALEAIRLGDGLFVAALHTLFQDNYEMPDQLLADRPEAVLALQGFDSLLDDSSYSDGDVFVPMNSETVEKFLYREGFAIAAALFRSEGWSGVELLRWTPPRVTAHVVRPDRWLHGEDIGTWKRGEPHTQLYSKDGWQLVNEGLVGPAIMSLWLSQHVEPALARTVYSGWASDTYSYYAKERQVAEDETEAWLFEWISQWDSPHSARQVAEVVEQSMGKLFRRDNGLERDQERLHFQVVQQGLMVAVVVSNEQPSEAWGDEWRELLPQVQVMYQPNEETLLSFVPTRFERFLDAYNEAELTRGIWLDRSSNLRMNLSSLSSEWRIQQVDHATLRWFVHHLDERAHMQLTTQLVDLLQPEFGSEAYIDFVISKLEESLPHTEAQLIERNSLDDLGDVLAFEVTPFGDSNLPALNIWQVKSTDVVVTFSLQAPPELIERYADQARGIFFSAEALNTEKSISFSREKDSGVIEFEVDGE